MAVQVNPGLMQATLFLGAAVLVVPILRRFGVATVLGYLITGVLLSALLPHMIGDSQSLMHMAEYGVVLLLFLIGLELQPARLWALRHSIFILGGLQMVLTGLVLLGLTRLAGADWDTAFVIGAGLALSSTAFVLQLLTERQQLGSTHGQKAFSILLFQDIAVIPLIAIMPILAGRRSGDPFDPMYLLTVAGVFIGLIVASRTLIRPIFRLVADSEARELLTAVALFIVMGVTLLMQQLGLSMALGAFLTGVLLADSAYRHELEASIEPFKGLLLGLFFMAVGMTTQVSLLLNMPLQIIGGALGLMLIKFGLIALLVRRLGNSWPVSMRLGVAICQGGEFAFVLFSEALRQGVLEPHYADPLILVVTLSMALTPLAFWLLDRFGEPRFAALKPGREFDRIPDDQHPVIIAGFGRLGQIIGRVLRAHQIEFTAIDRSARQVDFVRKFGNQIYYGDPANPDILHSAGVAHVRLFILALDDVEESIRVAEYLHRHHPHVTVLARARDRQHAYRLREIGIQHILRETLPAALEMAEMALVRLGLPPDQASDNIATFRQYDEDMMRQQQAVYDDEAKMIASARAAAAELESLFDSDQQTLRRQHQGQFDRVIFRLAEDETTLAPIDTAASESVTSESEASDSEASKSTVSETGAPTSTAQKHPPRPQD